MKDDIIRMAREAAAQITIQASGDVFYSFYGIELERFAQLVAAAEREACVVAGFAACLSQDDAVRVREAIRARGKQ